MPCSQMKELEFLGNRLADRRSQAQQPVEERRKGEGFGWRAGEARVAYLMQLHRVNCDICKAQ